MLRLGRGPRPSCQLRVADIAGVENGLPGAAAVGRCLEELANRVLADREEGELLEEAGAIRTEGPALEAHRAVLELAGVIQRATELVGPDLAPFAAAPIVEVHALAGAAGGCGPVLHQEALLEQLIYAIGAKDSHVGPGGCCQGVTSQ